MLSEGWSTNARRCSFRRGRPRPVLPSACSWPACSRPPFFTGFSDWTAAWQTAGFAIASYDFKDDRYTWGADAGVATFTALLAEARRRWSVRRPIVCGSSRGGLTALVWAHRNPGVPVAWFGMNPVMNLGPFYDLAGRSQSLNQAYGIQNKAELIRDVCPRVNPVDLAVDLTWLPLRAWQGRDDQVTPPP